MEQSLPAGEIVVVYDPDKSGDRTWNLYLKRNFRAVHFLEQPGNGMASAISYGILKSQQPFIAFLDSDDLWAPEKQRIQVDYLHQRPSLDAVYGLAVNKAQGPFGPSALMAPRPAPMFTATTFRKETFDRFGTPDSTATHHTWLYRWWHQARFAGIKADAVPHLVLTRRLHQHNSWRLQGGVAHQDLLQEIRQICAYKRAPQ
jgi:glycosyltransferase involved in cell wall biosynthesis